MSLQEVNEVAAVISHICADDANIIFGTSVDDSYGDEIAVTVVATQFEPPAQQRSSGAAAAEEAPAATPYSQWQPPPEPKRKRGLFNPFG